MACKTDLYDQRAVEKKLGVKLAIVYEAIYFEESTVTEAFNIIQKLVSLTSEGILYTLSILKLVPSESDRNKFDSFKNELRSWNTASRNSEEMVQLRGKLSIMSLKDAVYAKPTLNIDQIRHSLPTESSPDLKIKLELDKDYMNSTRASLPIYEQSLPPIITTIAPQRNESLKRNLLPEKEKIYTVYKEPEIYNIKEGASIDGLIENLISVLNFGMILLLLLLISKINN